MQINRNQQILMEIIENYKKLKEVESIGLGGSSTAKMADNKSDYDIYIYGKSEPPAAERQNSQKNLPITQKLIIITLKQAILTDSGKRENQ